MSAPLETKVAASSGAALAVTTIIAALDQWVPAFTPPSAQLTALIITLVTLVAGWVAPHTSRQPKPLPLAVPPTPTKPEGTKP